MSKKWMSGTTNKQTNKNAMSISLFFIAWATTPQLQLIPTDLLVTTAIFATLQWTDIILPLLPQFILTTCCGCWSAFHYHRCAIAGSQTPTHQNSATITANRAGLASFISSRAIAWLISSMQHATCNILPQSLATSYMSLCVCLVVHPSDIHHNHHNH